MLAFPWGKATEPAGISGPIPVRSYVPREMWEAITQWGGWEPTREVVAWLITSCLLVVGLAGCVVPVLPGHLILLGAAVFHRLFLGKEASGLEWWSFAILGALMVISQAFEIAAGAAGSKWFGGTKWGAWGALVGGLAGMFFFPLGLILGPLIGAFLFEKLGAKLELKPAAVSGVGSVVGTVAGMGMKVAVGIVMVAWLVADALWIGN